MAFIRLFMPWPPVMMSLPFSYSVCSVVLSFPRVIIFFFFFQIKSFYPLCEHEIPFAGSLTEQILQGPIGIGIGIVFGSVYGLMLTMVPSRNSVSNFDFYISLSLCLSLPLFMLHFLLSKRKFTRLKRC